MQFTDFNLNKSLLKALVQAKYYKPTAIQERAIPLILSGKDLIASAQTGTGKTAAFSLPIIHNLINNQDSKKQSKKIKALVISPTRELAIQIEESFETYGKFTNLRSTVIYG